MGIRASLTLSQNKKWQREALPLFILVGLTQKTE
jgi:hypothetical protein